MTLFQIEQHLEQCRSNTTRFFICFFYLGTILGQMTDVRRINIDFTLRIFFVSH